MQLLLSTDVTKRGVSGVPALGLHGKTHSEAQRRVRQGSASLLKKNNLSAGPGMTGSNRHLWTAEESRRLLEDVASPHANRRLDG
jgi:hypothetical protein